MGEHLIGGLEDGVDQPHPLAFAGQYNTAGEQHVVGAGDADQARQQPREPVFGGQAQLPVRGRELRIRDRKTNVRVARQDQSNARGRPVDRRDHRLFQAEVVGEVLIELGAHAIAGHRQLGRVRAGVVAALGDVAFERRRIRARTERAAGPRHDDCPHIRVVLGVLQAPAVFGVHPARPGIQAVRAVQGDCGHSQVGGVPNGFQLHGAILGRCGAGVARWSRPSDGRIGRRGAQRSGFPRHCEPDIRLMLALDWVV